MEDLQIFLSRLNSSNKEAPEQNHWFRLTNPDVKKYYNVGGKNNVVKMVETFLFVAFIITQSKYLMIDD
jgi:hypothetical protein